MGDPRFLSARRIVVLGLVGIGMPVLAACPGISRAPSQTVTNGQPPAGVQVDATQARREAMVAQQIEARGVTDPAVLAAMRRVPRHRFVPATLQAEAYDDGPLPIGHGQTISQPYIVAYMSEALRASKGHRVLEIGTGSAYQAAVLAELAGEVYTIEIVPELGERAKAVLEELGYGSVHVRIGDGYLGWPEAAPFDRIMVTAAPDRIPPPLLEQLAVGGRLIAPVGTWEQEIHIMTKTEHGVTDQVTIPVRFVPLTRKPPGDH